MTTLKATRLFDVVAVAITIATVIMVPPAEAAPQPQPQTPSVKTGDPWANLPLQAQRLREAFRQAFGVDPILPSAASCTDKSCSFDNKTGEEKPGANFTWPMVSYDESTKNWFEKWSMEGSHPWSGLDIAKDVVAKATHVLDLGPAWKGAVGRSNWSIGPYYTILYQGKYYPKGEAGGDLICSKAQVTVFHTVYGTAMPLSSDGVNTDWEKFSQEVDRLTEAAKTELEQKLRTFAKVAGANGACEPPPHLPIIFLPGVAGTILDIEDKSAIIAMGDEVWPTASVGNRVYLGLEADGRTSFDSGRAVLVKDILRRVGMNFYGGIMDFIKAKGYTEGSGSALPESNVDLYAFPYDWRVDNARHFTELDLVIEKALKQNPDAKKVILLAHSMGGYIARGYILSSPDRAAKVDALITMGTPYWGAPKPYYGVVSGYTFGNPTIRQELMKVMLQNMPAAYQLMPNYPFIVDATNKRMLTSDESARLRYKGLTYGAGTVTEYALAPFYDAYQETPDNRWFFNPGLVKLAQEFNRPLGTKEKPTPLPGGAKHYAIIGTGVKTLTLFYLRDAGSNERFVELNGRKVVLQPFFSDGDGTVPLQGSEISTATATYYIPYSKGTSSAHGDLPAHPIVQQIVGAIIDRNPPDPRQYAYSMASKGLKDVEEGADFTLHSDAHLSIVDAGTGKLLGFNNQGGINEDLPSGSFLSMEGVEYASIADIDRPLKVSVTGIRDGKFTLDVNAKRAGNTVAQFSYREVPVKNGTVAQVSLIPGQVTNPPSLSVTTDGRTANIPASSGTMPASAAPGGGPTPGIAGGVAGVGGGGPVPGSGPGPVAGGAGGAPSGQVPGAAPSAVGGGTLGAPSPLPTDLTGLWVDPSGRAVYYVRQVGNKVYWSVDGRAFGGSMNVYVGEISGNVINGVWVDMPQSPTFNTGQLSLRIESNDHLAKAAPSPYGQQEWRRQGTTPTVSPPRPPSPPPPSPPTAPSSVSGNLTRAWHLTSNCPWYGDLKAHGTWRATVFLSEAANGSLTGSISDDPLKPEVLVDDQGHDWRNSANTPFKSQHAGNTMTLVLHPSGWESVLKLTGTISGSGIRGGVVHYGQDDCAFTMTPAVK